MPLVIPTDKVFSCGSLLSRCVELESKITHSIPESVTCIPTINVAFFEFSQLLAFP